MLRISAILILCENGQSPYTKRNEDENVGWTNLLGACYFLLLADSFSVESMTMISDAIPRSAKNLS